MRAAPSLLLRAFPATPSLVVVLSTRLLGDALVRRLAARHAAR